MSYRAIRNTVYMSLDSVHYILIPWCRSSTSLNMCILTSLCCLFVDQLSCAGPKLGKACWLGGAGGGGGCRDVRPLANPPSARHGTFAEQGPPTWKACNRQQTQQRDRPCSGRTIFGDENTAGRCSGAADGAHKAAVKHGVTAVLRVEEQRLTEEEISFHRCRSGQPCSPGPAVRCSRVRFAPSVL